MFNSEEISAPSFAGHESFPLRFTWLSKGVQATQRYPDLFGSDDALVHLGVGKNMVRAIRYWGLKAGVLIETRDQSKNRVSQVVPSAFGRMLFGTDEGLDPFLEDSATLWLIHWQLASRPQGPTTWYWAFNEYPDAEFTKAKFRAALMQYVERAGWKRVAESSLGRDCDCFLHTYVAGDRAASGVHEESLECPLTELGLVQDVDGLGVYAFNRGEHPSLPLAIFAYALLEFWGTHAPASKTLTFDQIAYHPGSPGRVFKLSDDALSDHLDRIGKVTHGAIGYGVTAGLRQLYCRNTITPDLQMSVLKHYYTQGAR